MIKDQVIEVITQCESVDRLHPNGNLYAIGDNGKAYGLLQIWQDVLTDVNRANGTHVTQQQLLGNRELSVWVFWEYMKLYATSHRFGRHVRAIDMARIWNAGPNGWRRAAGIPYGERFKKIAYARGYDPECVSDYEL
jgi:hypothetical protein